MYLNHVQYYKDILLIWQVSHLIERKYYVMKTRNYITGNDEA